MSLVDETTKAAVEPTTRMERACWWALVEWEASMTMLLKEGGVIGTEAKQDIERIRDIRIRLWPTRELRTRLYDEL